MSRRRHRKLNRRAGNITDEPLYDPFPKSGLVKQHEQFIRKYVSRFCRQYPDIDRERVLFRAVEIALAAERAYKPTQGSFATYLGYRLKELHRLHDEDEKGNTSPVHYSKGELEQDRAEERGEDVKLDFSGGYNGARLTFDLQWWLPKFFSYIDRLTDSIVILRHRIAAGIQLKGSDNVPAIQRRISADLPEVVRQQPVGETLSGWTRAVIDHLIRRQREADDEAAKRAVGDHSPTFLEGERHKVDVRFPSAKRPPRHLPTRRPIASLDTYMRENDNGDAPGSLHDIIGAGGNSDTPIGDGSALDKQAETMRQALKEIQPDLSKNEQVVAEEMLARLEGHRSRGLAALGISKGYASKIWHGLIDKVTAKISSRK